MSVPFPRTAGFARLLLCTLLACSPVPGSPGSDHALLEAATRRWVVAVNDQNMDALTVTMTADVELLDGALTVTGRDAALRTLRDVATRGRLAATTRELTIAGDVAWHVVWLTQTRKNGDLHALGQALEIWTRADGKWKLHRQIAAGVISPADRLTRPSTSAPVLDRSQH